MRIPKSPHFPFYDFSTIFYDFTKFNKYLSQIGKKKLKPKQAESHSAREGHGANPASRPTRGPAKEQRGKGLR
jgi:hypothetical protein